MNESLIKKETVAKKNPNLIYNQLIFHGYNNNKKFDKFSIESKYSFPLTFYDDLEKLIKMKLSNLILKKEKEKVYNSVTKLYNKYFNDYYNEYYKLLDAKKKISVRNSSL